MEFLKIGIEFLFVTLIILIPIILTAKGNSSLRVIMISYPLIFLFVILGAYWPHFYADVRLELMGFDFEGMNDAERMRNVKLDLRAEASKLYSSNMGIGWPLRAMLRMIFIAPYPIVVCIFAGIIRYIRRKYDI